MAYFAWKYDRAGLHVGGGADHDADDASFAVRASVLRFLDGVAYVVIINGSEICRGLVRGCVQRVVFYKFSLAS